MYVSIFQTLTKPVFFHKYLLHHSVSKSRVNISLPSCSECSTPESCAQAPGLDAAPRARSCTRNHILLAHGDVTVSLSPSVLPWKQHSGAAEALTGTAEMLFPAQQ